MITVEKTEKFQQLFSEFKQIHLERKATPTFLEIAGKAHKEDVISNILAFFFDSNQPHNLGTIFLDTFLKCMGISIAETEKITYVSREITTAKGKRIDIIVETEDFILVIENKIHHYLNNDLNEYATHVKRQYRGRKSYLGVLSLYQQDNCGHGFINVTYDNFIPVLEERIGQLDQSLIKDYYPLLSDLFKSIKRLKTHNMLDEQLRAFFVSNSDIIGELLEEKGRFDNENHSKAYTLQTLLKIPHGIKSFIWSKCVVVNEKLFPNNMLLKVDCIVGTEGYWFHVFVQRQGYDETTASVLESIPYFKDKTDWHAWLPEKAIPHDTPIQEVADQMNKIIGVVFNGEAEA